MCYLLDDAKIVQCAIVDCRVLYVALDINCAHVRLLFHTNTVIVRFHLLQGLISNVTFGGETLTTWSMYPINLTQVFDNVESNDLTFRFALAGVC